MDLDLLRSQAVRADAAREGLLAACRRNAAVFAQYALRNEAGGSIRLAPHHIEWHHLIDTCKNVVLMGHVESGKTLQLAARVVWELGTDPTMRVCILSNTHKQAVKISRLIAGYIDQPGRTHNVFPDLRPGTIWNDASLYIRRPPHIKDPSVQATGVAGNITGARLDLVVVDDILDPENTSNEEQRQKTWDWYYKVIDSRLSDRARVVVIGNPFHRHDALHRWAKLPGWEFRKYPVIDPVTGQPNWPEVWPLERIQRKAAELNAASPTEFARQMLCEARDDATSRFKIEWIQRAKERGRGKVLPRRVGDLPAGVRTYTGVDLAVQQHDRADLTVLFTIAAWPDGTREVLCCESGRWAGPEIIVKVVEHHQRYQSVVVMENVAAQEYLLQFARRMTAVPIKAFTTGRGRASLDFQTEGLAAEMASGKWVVPCSRDLVAVPEVQSWLDEILEYDPNQHTGDRLAASLFARHGAFLAGQTVQFGRLDVMSR